MIDFRTEYSRKVIRSLSEDLSIALYFDKILFEKSVISVWRQIEDNILTQNTLFFNYQYALYTVTLSHNTYCSHFSSCGLVLY